MPDRRKFLSRDPVNMTLEIIGDRWSLRIVRNLMFEGHNSFGALLDAGEGISTSVLADRLRRFEVHRIIRRAPVPGDNRRIKYQLTKRGIDLGPILVEMMLWSSAYQ
jgi:DNA-binding HxlR family transcriptional regulator